MQIYIQKHNYKKYMYLPFVCRVQEAEKKEPVILGIESSCDETATAVIRGRKILSDEIASSASVQALYGGVVPDTIEELVKLPGVGRKTANLIVGDVFGKPAVVTDTHCIRISGRLGLTDETDPFKVEKDLRAILPPEKSNDFCHRLVLHGRAVCDSRKPKCDVCCMRDFCRYVETTGAVDPKKQAAKKARKQP